MQQYMDNLATNYAAMPRNMITYPYYSHSYPTMIMDHGVVFFTQFNPNIQYLTQFYPISYYLFCMPINVMTPYPFLNISYAGSPNAQLVSGTFPQIAYSLSDTSNSLDYYMNSAIMGPPQTVSNTKLNISNPPPITTATDLLVPAKRNYRDACVEAIPHEFKGSVNKKVLKAENKIFNIAPTRDACVEAIPQEFKSINSKQVLETEHKMLNFDLTYDGYVKVIPEMNELLNSQDTDSKNGSKMSKENDNCHVYSKPDLSSLVKDIKAFSQKFSYEKFQRDKFLYKNFSLDRINEAPFGEEYLSVYNQDWERYNHRQKMQECLKPIYTNPYPRNMLPNGSHKDYSNSKLQPSKDELISKVCSILKKSTPEKIEPLVEQIIELKINTMDKMEEIMNLIFEKAIFAPNFLWYYAKMCHCLISKASDMRVALLKTIERGFKQHVTNINATEEKLKPLKEKYEKCQNVKEKLKLKTSLIEEVRKIKICSLSTVRFIGELFKISVISGFIIHCCIWALLKESHNEYMLESLCKLLTVAGKKYEETYMSEQNEIKYSLNSVMNRLQNIASKPKTSFRIKFVLEETIYLRNKRMFNQSTHN